MIHRWFRWNPEVVVVTPVPLDPQELKVMAAWGHTPASWAALTDQQRTRARRDYLKAPGYVG